MGTPSPLRGLSISLRRHCTTKVMAYHIIRNLFLRCISSAEFRGFCFFLLYYLFFLQEQHSFWYLIVAINFPHKMVLFF